MLEYYVLNHDPRMSLVLEFIHSHNLTHELHLNRTRFWVPPGPIRTEFMLRHADHCAPVLSDPQ